MTHDPDNHFGSQLRSLLTQADISYRTLGRRLGISHAAISYWVTGTHAPEPPMVFQLERELGVEPGSLSRHLGYVPVDIPSAATIEDSCEQLWAEVSYLHELLDAEIAALRLWLKPSLTR